jgi:ribosomal protein L37AE/L43A
MAKYDDCTNCGSSKVSFTEPTVATCTECAHQWDVNTGKPVG